MKYSDDERGSAPNHSPSLEHTDEHPQGDDARRRPAGDGPTSTTGFVTRFYGVRPNMADGSSRVGFDSARPFQ
jgi:hypothetical protein